MLFDTSAILDYLKGGGKTKEIVESEERRREPTATSTISIFELLSPIFHRRLSEEERTLKAFFRQTTVLPFDARSSEEAAKIMGAPSQDWKADKHTRYACLWDRVGQRS
ncbi:MAG: type II toxin-antitoxin system VapC family toxin [Thaumarchaeota archaeon]|nr:type II toxin-antitoxin system VapC family toxin [Nitrososphaerota archaeon]